MRQIPNALQAAKPEHVRAEDLPVLPAWYPAPPREGPAPSELGRAMARQRAAMTEARRGPWDGATGLLLVAEGGAPPELLAPRADAPGFVYRLDPDDSRADWLVYRYSPRDSFSHGACMRAVEQGYLELGPGYVDLTRDDGPVTSGATLERTS